MFELKCRGAKVKRLNDHDNVLMLQWISNEREPVLISLFDRRTL